jgi:hypothetical protein
MLLPLEWGHSLISTNTSRTALLNPFKAVLVLDEEWRTHFGDRAEFEARLVVTRAIGHYSSLGVRVELGIYRRIERWRCVQLGLLAN